MEGNMMMMIRALFVLGVALLCDGQIVRAEQPLSPDQAIAANGKRVSMRGVVSEVVRRDNGYIYVNVGGKYPDHVFAVWIHKMDVDEFPKVDTWTGRKMTFSGVFEIYKGKPMIRIRKPGDSAVAE